MIKNVKKARSDINYKVIDIEKPINVKGSFDYIIGFEVLEHVRNTRKSLENLRKKLKKEGVEDFNFYYIYCTI